MRERSKGVEERESKRAMDEETERLIKDAVEAILAEVDMNMATEGVVRKMASERLGLDLSLPPRRRFVRSVVESFLVSNNSGSSDGDGDGSGSAHQQPQHPEKEQAQEKQEEEDEEEEEDTKRKRRSEKEYDDDGDLIICRLSNKRRVTLQDFRGKTLVSIREFYEKDGRQLPSSKGISLTVDQWKAFRKAVPAIQEAIKKMQGLD